MNSPILLIGPPGVGKTTAGCLVFQGENLYYLKSKGRKPCKATSQPKKKKILSIGSLKHFGHRKEYKMMKRSSLSLRQRFVRWSLVLVFMIASTALTSRPAQASDNHCITPTGIDLNALYDITKQIVTPFCNQVDSGEHWTAAEAGWFMNTSFEAMPEGFVPAGATPLEDFLAKFVVIKYVVDPGTRQEQTYVYPISDKLWIGTTAGFPTVWPGTLSKLPPLRVGEHFVVVYWVFSAMHCDGFTAVVEENCLGPGEVAYVALSFEVTPGAAQSNK